MLTAAGAGRARWVHSWSRFAEPVIEPELSAALDGAVGAVLAFQPDPAPLRALLEAEGLLR